MMVSVGNFLFRTRNAQFPLLYLTLFAGFQRVSEASEMMLIAGSLIALVGQGIRILTVGLDYIVRGGRNKRVYANDRVLNDSSDDWVLSAGLVGLILLACLGIRVLKRSGRLSAKPAR